MATWKFYLCQSSDMTRLGEFTQATGRQLQVALNRSGSFSANVNMLDPLATSIAPLTTCVEAVKNGTTVWSGPVMSAIHELPSRKIGMQCVGWFELLKRRVIRDRGVVSYDLTNPGGETGTETGWTFVNSGTGSHANSAGAAYSGTRSELLATGASGSSIMSQNFTVPLGAIVTATVWFNSSLTSSSVSASPQFGITGPGPGLTPTYAYSHPSTTTAGVWAQMSVSWIATVTNVAIIADVNSVLDPAHSVYFDDFVVTYETLRFDNVDIGEVAQSLVDRVNSWDSCPVKRGTTQTSWDRSVRFTPFQNVGEEIQRMSDVENGFDFDVDPSTRTLDIYYPMQGVVRTSYDAPLEAVSKMGPTSAWTFADSSTTTTPAVYGVATSWTGTGYGVSQPTLCSYNPGDFSKTKVMGAGVRFGDQTNDTYYDIMQKSYSVSIQFKLSSLASIDRFDVIYLTGLGGCLNLWADGHLTFYPVESGADVITTAAGTIVAGTTYHLVITYDHATRNAVLYLNGVALATLACANPSRSVSSRIGFIFQQSAAGAGTPTLTVDDMAIWTGRSLSYSEVKFYYQSLRQRAVPSIEAVRFGYGARGAGNLASVTKRVETARMSNWIVAQGKGSTAGGGALAKDTSSISTYGAFDEATQLSQTDSVQLLAAYANAEVAIRGRPSLTYEMQPLTASQASSTGVVVPSPFEDYNVGDVVQFDALDGTIDVTEQNMRVFGISISLDDKTDAERTTLQTAPGS